MKAVAPDRRPPPAAWGLMVLPLLPLSFANMAQRYGWFDGVPYLSGLWSMVLVGICAGLIAAPAVLRGRWLVAYAAMSAPILSLMTLWTGILNAAESVSLGLLLILGLDLWAARAGLVPDWWPRLKLGFTVLAVALLIARHFS
ncbi:MAG: hypothetical protein DI616_05625 [Paracoccus denitrificans]|uniref:DUF3429 domain-containing protein n=1 Tax=Paracoccus denitrificans TaxID=266 RepID=A0A533ICH9_PARDE|nr:MAG: hypothetical protein DI616_05625 [Paracoccus denitrificans]